MLALSHCQRTWHSCAQQSSNILFIKYSLGFYLSGFVLDANGSSARSKTGLLSLELPQSTARVSQLSLKWAGKQTFYLAGWEVSDEIWEVQNPLQEICGRGGTAVFTRTGLDPSCSFLTASPVEEAHSWTNCKTALSRVPSRLGQWGRLSGEDEM